MNSSSRIYIPKKGLRPHKLYGIPYDVYLSIVDIGYIEVTTILKGRVIDKYGWSWHKDTYTVVDRHTVGGEFI